MAESVDEDSNSCLKDVDLRSMRVPDCIVEMFSFNSVVVISLENVVDTTNGLVLLSGRGDDISASVLCVFGKVLELVLSTDIDVTDGNPAFFE